MHYNFFRPHESLKDKTPAEKAGLNFPYKDWEDVVRGSGKSLSWKREADKSVDRVLPFTTIRPTMLKSKKHKPRKRARVVISGLSTIRR